VAECFPEIDDRQAEKHPANRSYLICFIDLLISLELLHVALGHH